MKANTAVAEILLYLRVPVWLATGADEPTLSLLQQALVTQSTRSALPEKGRCAMRTAGCTNMEDNMGLILSTSSTNSRTDATSREVRNHSWLWLPGNNIVLIKSFLRLHMLQK